VSLGVLSSYFDNIGYAGLVRHSNTCPKIKTQLDKNDNTAAN